jgi:hypothetical protein
VQCNELLEYIGSYLRERSVIEKEATLIEALVWRRILILRRFVLLLLRIWFWCIEIWGGGLAFKRAVSNLRERGRWGDPDVDGRIILIWIFRKLDGVVGTGGSWLRIGTVGGHL